LVKVLLGDLFHGIPRRDTGVVYEDVQPPEVRSHIIDRSADLVELAHVHLQRERAPTERLDVSLNECVRVEDSVDTILLAANMLSSIMDRARNILAGPRLAPAITANTVSPRFRAALLLESDARAWTAYGIANAGTIARVPSRLSNLVDLMSLS